MATSISVPQVTQQAPDRIAPVWHTVLLVAFLLVFSFLGSEGHPGLNHSAKVRFYAMTIGMEWILVGYIVWGLRRTRRTNLRELIGGRWNRFEDFLLDIAIAVGFWFASLLVLAAMGYLLGMNNMATVQDMKRRIGSILPEGSLEISLWIALSITAGFCEEIIFRGYFQKQFAALLKFAWAGIIVQGLIFGASHAYEGWRQMLRIAVFGIMFGLLVHWRKNLRSAMMAHFAQDAVMGLLAGFVLKHADKALPRS
jgi:membrane protease YdiL (CAAX protease family)